VEYSTLSPENLAIHCFHSTDETAWAEFVRRFHPLIARVAIRVAREWGEESKQVVDDLIQDTYLKLFENRRDLAERFKPAHTDAIFGYIQVFTTNLVHDRFKASRSQKRGGGLTTSLGDKSEDAFSLKKSLSPPLADLDRVVLIRQIESCLQSIAPGETGRRDRQIFWLYYRAGLTARAIASLPAIGLSTKGVESTLTRLGSQIRDQLLGRRDMMPDFRKARKGKESIESL